MLLSSGAARCGSLAPIPGRAAGLFPPPAEIFFCRNGNRIAPPAVSTLAGRRQDACLVQHDRKRRFELLALPHLDAAFNLARWLAGNTADAEDVVQEAYLRAFRYFDAYQGGNFRVWLLTIVRNSFFTWAKENRSGRLVFHAETPAGDTARPKRPPGARRRAIRKRC